MAPVPPVLSRILGMLFKELLNDKSIGTHIYYLLIRIDF